MNPTARSRLLAVRAAVATMEPDHTPSQAATLGRVNSEKLMSGRPLKVPTHVNMGTMLAERNSFDNDNGCATIGCLAGITVALFPTETHKEWENDKATARKYGTWPDQFASIGRVLGLSRKVTGDLFFAHGSRHRLEDIPKDEILTAIDRVIKGVNTTELWET